VLVEKDGRLIDAGVTFSSPETVQSVIDALLALNGENARPGETILPIHFAGGEARGMAVLPPTAVQGPCLVIRKLMNTGWISWEKLMEWGSVTQETYEFLKRAVHAHVNILMAGGASAGKITIASRIAELVPAEERLVIVEDTHELQIRHPRAVYLEAAGRPGVSLSNLIHAAAQMRPDRLILGELRGAEAMCAIEVLGSGYSGMTTIHANSLDDALTRLEAFCLTANLGLGLLEIRNLIASAIQLICYQKYLANEKRKIIEIAEIRGVENGQFLLERLFRYDSVSDKLQATGIKPSWE